MRVSHLIISFLLAFSLLLGSARTPSPAAHNSQDRFAEMDNYILARMEASSIPGGGYAIVEDGEVVHMAAFGVASLKDRRPLTVQTPMMIGSVGKTITALAIRQLAGAGKIEMSAPVTRYLPWFELATPGAAQSITLQNLLDHKSGLSTFDGQNLPRVYRPGLTPEEVARSLKEIETVRPAGTVEEYSNLNFILLGVVVEAVSGQSYGDYLKQYIFDPLEMEHSTIDYEAALASGLTEGHHYLFGMPVAYEEPFPSGVVPAGYHITCIEDMARYAAAFSNGGEFNGISVVTADGRPQASRPVFNIHWEPTGGFKPYDSTGHSGANLNANAALEYMPLERLGVVVMFNANPTQFMNLPEGPPT